MLSDSIDNAFSNTDPGHNLKFSGEFFCLEHALGIYAFLTILFIRTPLGLLADQLSFALEEILARNNIVDALYSEAKFLHSFSLQMTLFVNQLKSIRLMMNRQDINTYFKTMQLNEVSTKLEPINGESLQDLQTIQFKNGTFVFLQQPILLNITCPGLASKFEIVVNTPSLCCFK